MQLRYYVPFRAQTGVDGEEALKQKLLNIEGLAVDTSVNKNKWQVPEEDLDFFTETLKGAQLRADHAESVFMIVGKVPEARRQGEEVYFRAEVGGEEKLIDKILRGYVKYASVQVDSDDVECSKCKRPTRKEGMLVHLCPGAWEIVHKPRVRELSIVASPAYEKTEFRPVGFGAAMNDSQWDAVMKSVGSNPTENDSRSLQSDDVGSRQSPQGPENKKCDTKEVKPLSENAQAKASPHQAQGVVNTAPEEQAPKQVTYEEYMQQLTQLEKQITQAGSAASDAEMDAMTKKIADLEAEIAKRAKKGELSKKISELTQKLGEPDQEEGQEEGTKLPKAEAKRASGRGIVAVDEIEKDTLRSYEWYQDLLKAHKRLVGFQ